MWGWIDQLITDDNLREGLRAGDLLRLSVQRGGSLIDLNIPLFKRDTKLSQGAG